VRALSDDERIFTIVSSARTMIFEAQTIAEHRYWLFSLIQLCQGADTNGVNSRPSELILVNIHSLSCLLGTSVHYEHPSLCR